jgi:hypothetical protein
VIPKIAAKKFAMPAEDQISVLRKKESIKK